MWHPTADQTLLILLSVFVLATVLEMRFLSAKLGRVDNKLGQNQVLLNRVLVYFDDLEQERHDKLMNKEREVRDKEKEDWDNDP